MSEKYDEYLMQHRENVAKGYRWISQYLPELIEGKLAADWQITYEHDSSKYDSDEYNAYDDYFYGGNKSYQVVEDFRLAWLRHIHRNPHHWQYWVLINDDPEEGEIILDMPYNYILEMICDWWSFSWSKGDLHEIFAWYNKHEKHIKLSEKTRKTVDDILEKICVKLHELDTNGYERID